MYLGEKRRIIDTISTSDKLFFFLNIVKEICNSQMFQLKI